MVLFWVVLGGILILLGNGAIYYGSEIRNKERSRKLNETISKFSSRQLDIYEKTLESSLRGEIHPPTAFIKEQEEAIMSSANDIEQWAKDLSGVKGLEKDKSKMEFLALDLKAKQIDAKLRLAINPIIDSFKEVIAALNKADAFKGKIDLKISEATERIVIAHTEHKKPQRPIQKVIIITFPSGKRWVGKLFPLIIKPETPSNFENGPFIHLDGGNIRAEFYILVDGSYRFTPKEPKEWPVNLAGKVGSKQLVIEAIKYIFQKEMMLNQSNR